MKHTRVVAVAGVLMGLVLLPATSSLAARSAVPHASTYHATFHARVSRVHRTWFARAHWQLRPVAHTSRAHATVAHSPKSAPFRSPAGAFPSKNATGKGAPIVSSSGALPVAATGKQAPTGGPSLVHAFNGASDLDSATINGGPGFEVTPPDQGLCVGHDALLPGNPTAVFDDLNLVVRETTPSGALLRPDTPLMSFMGDTVYASDPRCFWDASTQSFYFTDIGANSTTFNYTLDVAVLNAHGFATYQFDNTEGGNCLPDQPKTGFDNNALVVSTDQYCNDGYEGALVLAISKSQLAAEASTVNYATLGPVSLGGVHVTGLDPAINTRTGTSYFVNSFPFTAQGNNNATSTSLGVWTLTGDSAVTSGVGTLTLSGKLISSELYAFPVPAVSTGDGSVTCVTFCYYSEPALNPDDSRLSGPVSVSGAGSDSTIRLWTALSTAVNVPGNPSALDGAAWFVINPGAGKVQAQGYVAANNDYLIYPAVGSPANGNSKNFADMVFTLSSGTQNPSSAYTTVGGGPGGINTVAAGTSPHTSFAPIYFGQSRWGDYSFVAPDPSGTGTWLATEYIPPLANQDPVDNWGTSVFELSQ